MNAGSGDSAQRFGGFVAKYYSEKQLCDMIWDQRKHLLQIGWILSSPELHIEESFREHTIGYGLRPDFMTIQKPKSKKPEDFTMCVSVYEVKRHADAGSVAQLANYMQVVRKHLSDAFAHTYHPPLPFDQWPTVDGHLLALGFDQPVYSLAKQSNITLTRLTVSGDELQTSREAHPYEKMPLDSMSSSFFSKYWV
jgi:hypothetical protein